MGRILLVSNRLPVHAKVNHHGVSVELSSGGLATGLRDAYPQSQRLWIGWPGELPRLSKVRAAELDETLRGLGAVPVRLNRREVREFYEVVSNGVLWPLFHYLMDSMPAETRGWDTYRAVNERFADVVVEQYRPGDVIWVHDYHLLLLPAMIRQRLPDAHIGFFLHIPFPSSEVFSALPWREEILAGMLGADLIGFHTPFYLRHFAATLRRVLGLDIEVERLRYDGREIRVGAYPMGIDAVAWNRRASRSEVLRSAETIRNAQTGNSIIVGIDRLDYTKGIPRRLLAIERLLQEDPSLRGAVRMIQVTVPSREHVESYEAFRRKLDELVGRINGEFATPNWVPIHAIHRNLSPTEVAALYRAADVMLVTPLRDGMNLVAKEFVASREDEDGVLVLSEFAGAAWELGDALLVNPYDIDGLAANIRQALAMPAEERKRRMRSLRRRVMQHDVHRWVDSFVGDLRAMKQAGALRDMAPPRIDAAALAARIDGSSRLVMILDYDGTLVPFAPTPDAAEPDAALVELLQRLTRTPGIEVHVVSGRTRSSIERWLGQMELGLHAEHGLWSRMRARERWSMLHDVPSDWKGRVRPILQQFTDATPGSFIEDKTASVVWHYRGATGDAGAAGVGERQARELRLLLGELLSNEPLEVLPGSKVVEVRPLGMHKGVVVPQIAAAAGPGAQIVAIGDDRTDEDLFAALPHGAHSVHVGEGHSRARWRMDSIDDVRALLELIADARVVPPEFAVRTG